MAFPASKILSDLKKVQSWSVFQKIKRYVDANSSDYSSSELTEIQDAISQKDEYFNPPDCSLVERISLSFENHPNLLNLNREKAIGLCEEAKSNNTPLPEWIYGTYHLDGKEPTDFEIREHVISGFETKLAAQILPSIHGQRIRQEPGVVTVEFDRAALIDEMRKLREDFSEEAENLRAGIEKRITELNEIVKAMKNNQPLPQAVSDEIAKPYSITMSYSPGEYSVFSKVVASKNSPPIDIRILGRSKSEIRVQMSGTKENVDRITNAVSERYRTRPPPTIHMTQEAASLCSRYEHATGLQCNSHVRALGNRIHALFVENFGENYDPQLLEGLMDEVDLFLGSGPAKYTAEMADEAYSAFVQNVKDRLRTTSRNSECDPEMYNENLADYAAMLNLSREDLAQKDKLRKDMADIHKQLERCGFLDSRIIQEEENANGWFEAERGGTTFDEAVSLREESLRRKYGG